MLRGRTLESRLSVRRAPQLVPYSSRLSSCRKGLYEPIAPKLILAATGLPPATPDARLLGGGGAAALHRASRGGMRSSGGVRSSKGSRLATPVPLASLAPPPTSTLPPLGSALEAAAGEQQHGAGGGLPISASLPNLSRSIMDSERTLLRSRNVARFDVKYVVCGRVCSND